MSHILCIFLRINSLVCDPVFSIPGTGVNYNMLKMQTADGGTIK